MPTTANPLQHFIEDKINSLLKDKIELEKTISEFRALLARVPKRKAATPQKSKRKVAARRAVAKKTPSVKKAARKARKKVAPRKAKAAPKTRKSNANSGIVIAVRKEVMAAEPKIGIGAAELTQRMKKAGFNPKSSTIGAILTTMKNEGLVSHKTPKYFPIAAMNGKAT